MSETAIIETRQLTKEFHGGRGVHDVDLAVHKGQVFGFLGPNGAGKSTFVKMLVGLTRPTSGSAQVLGLPLGHIRARARVGYLPELFRYQEWLSATEVLRFHAKLCRLDTGEAADRIRSVLQEVGLSDRQHERVRTFSKGMQQRLGLACALLGNPELLFLDEPASALDPGGRHDVRLLLARLQSRGVTVFLNTHLLEDVEQVCTDVALLSHGRIRARGTVQDILRPEPVVEFTVAGWAEDLREALHRLTESVGITVAVHPSTNLEATLVTARLTDFMQAAWFNEALISLGLSVYRVEPRQNRMESWFLAITGEGREVI